MKACSRFFLPPLLVLLVSSLLFAQPSPKREFRGVWISTVTNIDWPSTVGLSEATQKQQLLNILDGMAAAGFNAVIFQVRPECDALYRSDIEPWSHWISGIQGVGPSYDPLQFAVEEAHKRGLEIHAWFNPYRAERKVGDYPLASNHVVNQHPEWIILSGTLKMLDPGKQAVRDYVTRVVLDVVRRYDVDGAHMDDYFYTDNMSYTLDAATYSAESRGFTDQGNWRRDNVNLLIHQIYDSIQTVKPWVKWGMSPRGIWKNGVPPGIIGADNYSQIWCDAVAWLQGRYIDYLAPQIYWKIGGSQDYTLLQPWWASQRNGRDLYPGLATYRIGDSKFGTVSMLLDELRFNRTSGNVQGSIQFTSGNIWRDNLGGVRDSLTNNLYHYPSLIPVMRWKDTVAPYMPRAIAYTAPGDSLPRLQWEVPNVAPDGDYASRYAIYRFDHNPTLPSELGDARNLLAVTGSTSFATKLRFSASGPYYYVATALDRNYNESEPSSVVTVTAPPIPVMLLPVPNATGLPDTTTLIWSRAAMAAGYHVQVSSDSTFAGSFLVNDSTLTDTSRIVRGLLGHVQYYWRVRAANAGGASAFATPSAFASGIPLATVPLSPANYAIDVPLSINMVWSKVADAESYRLQVSTSLDFSIIVQDVDNIVDTTAQSIALQPYKIYFWRVQTKNSAGTSAWSTVYRFRTQQVAGIQEEGDVPTEYGLSQNYPNPFNPVTNIRYSIPHAGRVTLRVYDILGNEVATLADGDVQPGVYTVSWDASNVASGVYFVRIIAGQYIASRRMLLLK